MLTERQLRIAAWCIADEIARRQRQAVPIPQALKDTHRALIAEVSNSGQPACQTDTGPPKSETARQVADRLGISGRTVRRTPPSTEGRRSAAAGYSKGAQRD